MLAEGSYQDARLSVPSAFLGGASSAAPALYFRSLQFQDDDIYEHQHGNPLLCSLMAVPCRAPPVLAKHMQQEG